MGETLEQSPTETSFLAVRFIGLRCTNVNMSDTSLVEVQVTSILKPLSSTQNVEYS